VILAARRTFVAGDGLVDHVVSVTDDGVIDDVRPRRDDDEVIDFGDATLLPGLVDAHVHLGFDASVDTVAQLQVDDDSTLLLRMRLAALRAAAVGITTVRDLGDRGYLSLTLREWFASGAEPGPRILASGPPITSTRGHCWFLGGEVDGIDGVRAAVRERAARGVDVVKVMASGGNLTPTVGPHESQFGRAELAAAVAEARACGLPLAVHAHGTQAVLDAIDVGADSIEHCTLFTADGVDTGADILARIAAGGSVISATAAVLPGQPVLHEAIRVRLEAILANLGTLHRSGARIVCSSDAGIAPIKPHDVLPHGVTGFLTDLGLTPAEAITNVTALAAEVCGVGDRVGTVEAGKDADVLVVAGDPLTDVTAIHDVLAVYTRGRRLPRRP
jgi:imidazolonepropionase-like amidohydrolase